MKDIIAFSDTGSGDESLPDLPSEPEGYTNGFSRAESACSSDDDESCYENGYGWVLSFWSSLACMGICWWRIDSKEVSSIAYNLPHCFDWLKSSSKLFLHCIDFWANFCVWARFPCMSSGEYFWEITGLYQWIDKCIVRIICNPA